MTSRRTLDGSLARRVDMKSSGSPAHRHTRLSPSVSRSRDRSPDKSPGYSFQSLHQIDDIGSVFSTFPPPPQPAASVPDYTSFVNPADSHHNFMATTSMPDRSHPNRVAQSQGSSLTQPPLAAPGAHLNFPSTSVIDRSNYLQASPRPTSLPQDIASQQLQTRVSLQDINPDVASLAPTQIQHTYAQSPPYTSQTHLFMRPPQPNANPDHPQSSPMYQSHMHSSLNRPFRSGAISGLPILPPGQFPAVDGALSVSTANADETYVLAAARAADRAKLTHRVLLKELQRAREADAQRSGLPLSAKDKERERSRRESAVTRKRAEVYIAELERVARRVPALERRVATLQAAQLALQGQLATRQPSHTVSPPSDVSPVSTNAVASEPLPP